MKPLAFASLAVVMLLSVAASPSPAPRWPAASLDYWNAAQPQLEALSEHAGAAWDAFGDGDEDATIEARDELIEIAEAIGELEPPPALLPAHMQIVYASDECVFGVNYAARLIEDGHENSVFAFPMVLAMRNECRRSIKDAFVEAARYAATVGGFPIEE